VFQPSLPDTPLAFGVVSGAVELVIEVVLRPVCAAKRLSKADRRQDDSGHRGQGQHIFERPGAGNSCGMAESTGPKEVVTNSRPGGDLRCCLASATRSSPSYFPGASASRMLALVEGTWRSLTNHVMAKASGAGGCERDALPPDRPNR